MNVRFFARRVLLSLCVPMLSLFVPAYLAAEGLQPNDRIAICGDSITEQKRYSVLMEEYLLVCRPAKGVRTAQFGWSGETSWQFAPRIQQDVLPFHPTVATTCYGMNDGGYAPLSEERAKNYRQATRDIVRQFKAAGVRFIVVGSPGVVDTATYPPGYMKPRPQGTSQELAATYNKTLGQVRDIAREVAAEEKVGFADIHAAMAEVMVKAKTKHGQDYAVAGGDGVHPGGNGHLVMAYAFLKALGCNGEIGTINVDLASGKAAASEGHQVLSMNLANKEVEIESEKYPVCFIEAGPASPGAILDLIDFNKDLNRLTLIVRNAGAERVRITWGSASKEFTAAALAEGINLAEEFPDNPFGPAFRKVDAAVRAQQEYETSMIKTLFHLEKGLVRDQEAFAKLKAGAMSRDEELAKTSAETVVPVRHTIKFELVK